MMNHVCFLGLTYFIFFTLICSSFVWPETIWFYAPEKSVVLNCDCATSFIYYFDLIYLLLLIVSIIASNCSSRDKSGSFERSVQFENRVQETQLSLLVVNTSVHSPSVESWDSSVEGVRMRSESSSVEFIGEEERNTVSVYESFLRLIAILSDESRYVRWENSSAWVYQRLFFYFWSPVEFGAKGDGACIHSGQN